jgi:hypothetical protein
MPLDSLRSRQHQATLTCFWSTFLPATAITVQLEDVSGEFCTWNVVEPTEWREPRFHFFDILGTVHSVAKGEVHVCACIKQHGRQELWDLWVPSRPIYKYEATQCSIHMQVWYWFARISTHHDQHFWTNLCSHKRSLVILWEPASWVELLFGYIRTHPWERPKTPKGNMKAIKWDWLGMAQDVWFYGSKIPRTHKACCLSSADIRMLVETQSLIIGTCFMNAWVLLQASLPGQNERSSDFVYLCAAVVMWAHWMFVLV